MKGEEAPQEGSKGLSTKEEKGDIPLFSLPKGIGFTVPASDSFSSLLPFFLRRRPHLGGLKTRLEGKYEQSPADCVMGEEQLSPLFLGVLHNSSPVHVQRW